MLVQFFSFLIQNDLDEMDGELLSGEPKKDFDWNGGLRRLLTDEVIIKPEVQNKYQDFVMHNVKEIYKFINREEPRFSSEMILTGSVKQRLNVHLPDQYDFNGLKQGKRTKRRRHRHYGLTGEYGVDPDHMHDDVIRTEVPVKVNLAIGEDFVNLKERDADMMLWGDSSDMVRDGDVVPYLVLLKLYHLLTRAGKEINNIKGEICDIIEHLHIAFVYKYVSRHIFRHEDASRHTFVHCGRNCLGSEPVN